MPRITDADVEAVNDAIAQAVSAGDAFDLIEGASRAMRGRLLDLNHLDPGATGMGNGAVMAIGWAHGWSWGSRDDYVPADGHGPCWIGRFEAHSRRPGQCRGCSRRPIDHRPVV